MCYLMAKNEGELTRARKGGNSTEDRRWNRCKSLWPGEMGKGSVGEGCGAL